MEGDSPILVEYCMSNNWKFW